MQGVGSSRCELVCLRASSTQLVSVFASVLLFLFLVSSASLSLASLDSVLSASQEHYDLFGISCQGLAEKKHGAPLVILNGTGSVVNVAFVGPVASGINQTG